ncbi:hypothetical protein BGX26_000514, partial [Mortierella sp. AD094]
MINTDLSPVKKALNFTKSLNRPENAGNVELLEYPEGSERNIYQENPLPLGNLGDDGQPAVDALCPATGEIHAAVDINHGASTLITVSNEARMSTGHFEGLSDSLVPEEKSQRLLDTPTSPCNDDLVNIGSTEVNSLLGEATNGRSIKEGDAVYLLNEAVSASLTLTDLAGPGVEVYEQFFTKMLADIDTPTLPYGLSNAHNDGADVTESYLALPQVLNDSLRGHAKRMGVSLASLCHLAWAQVISKTSGQEQVVFGTVLSGHIQGASDSDQGHFINTLPLRIDVGDTSVEESVRQTQADMAALLKH